MTFHLPGALLVAGSDDHRRRVFVRDLVNRCLREGYVHHPLDGTDREGLQGLLSTVGVLFSIPTLAVVSRPEKIVPGDVAEHLRTPNPSLVLLLVTDSDKPSGGILDGFPAAHTKLFPLPPFYKLDDHAAEYAVGLAKSRGIVLPDKMSRALVKLVGNDLGVVSFEVDKLVRLASARSRSTVELSDLRESLAALSESDGSSVADALGTRSRKTIADELSRYKATKKGDPTVELCGRVLTPTVFRWMQAAYLHGKGVSPAGAAGRVGSSPWYWENKVLPCAKVWGLQGCRHLLSAIATAQSAVFSGAVSPWNCLESGLLRHAG